MASLDVLDYQAGLDAALAKAGMEPAFRRAAMKDARRVVDAMAFRFAILDERPLPEDLDYLRALEAVKPPEKAADVLLARRPVYARARRRRLVTTWLALSIVSLAIVGLVVGATSEEAIELALIDRGTGPGASPSANATFTVTEEMTRLHLDGTVLLAKASPGVVEVWLIDPTGQPRVFESFYANGNIYLRENVYDPIPGVWTLTVDFLDASGSARVTVDGIRPTR